MVGIPGTDVDDLTAEQKQARGIVDDQGNVIFDDYTLRRLPSVTQGSPTFDRQQWSVHAKNTVDGLAAHWTFNNVWQGDAGDRWNDSADDWSRAAFPSYPDKVKIPSSVTLATTAASSALSIDVVGR